MNILLMGLPGAGKGTQAAKIVDAYDFPHISTGDMFRQAIADETELGKEAQSYMDAGGLVPDEVTNGIVDERLQQDDTAKGFMLDGYPRTLNQAQALEDIMSKQGKSIDAVIYFDVDPEVLKKRLSGRIICRDCGATYNKFFNPPKVDGVCDKCSSSNFYQREDDKAEVVENRIKVNMEQQKPLIDFYEERGKLHRVPGDIGIDNVFAKVQEIIDK
ncbi:adenylate kinase [Aerococcus kribbianus]|uniref:Adenylate kinase n=1 Tax=Aerococcus kribbianus TaxID=2999064 RepID=A0A9X3JFV3_9LACT|nr:MULTISPECIES: adenylate kinase [unclassified Aerococcus]MCZ0718075.1 adenylate kinase [Aerococcus sp. YH-aer221]MCZ0726356.1 adenylate kinase [Aerococcus sp. YH-aer222]